MQVKKQYVQALLALPRFANVSVTDLCRLAKEKLTYGTASGQTAGQVVKGIQTADRASAIAILVGYKRLDDPSFKIPMVIVSSK